MFVSYLVTTHNETDCLDSLLSKLMSFKKDNHEVVLLDDYSDNPTTISIIEKYKSSVNFQQKKLQNDYGAHKNYGISLCKGEWIFQIDADELPTDVLLENIDILLQSNAGNEALWLPRLNYFVGVTQTDIQMWGWNYHDGMINFPDYQWRIWKNNNKINWINKEHERLDGFKEYSALPQSEEFSLFHPKDIKRQERQNALYETI
jgi:glycosyltransferase involved in cell wall biosynthesis